jgi:hypothetical protein
MAADNFLRRLGGVIKNAVVWGAAWFGLAVVTMSVLRLTGAVTTSGFWLLDAIGIGIKVGVMGGIAGSAFAGFISLLYRGQRLSQINWVRFGIGGGVLAGFFVPTFMITANLLTGGEIPAFANIDEDIVLATVFGAITAGGSMWLAQRGRPLPIGGRSGHDGLGAGAPPFGADLRHREHAGFRAEI